MKFIEALRSDTAIRQQNQQKGRKSMAKSGETATYQFCVDRAASILADYQDGSTEMGIDEVEALAKLWISLAQEIRTGTYQSEAEFARIKEAILREQAAGDPM